MLQPRRISLILLLALFVASSTTFAETGKPPDKNAALRGKKVYVTHCQSCHGQRAEGETISPIFIRPPNEFLAPALDDSQHAWHHSDENLMKTILEGSPRTKRMMAFKGILTTRQVRDVVAYMKSLWGPRALECQGPKHMSCAH